MINVHFKNTQNFGDLKSAISNYLPMPSIDWQDITGEEELIAGGGILPLSLATKIRSKYLVLACGGLTNTKKDLPKKATIIGWRDITTAPIGCWCPCLSCLLPEFNIDYTTKRKNGFVSNLQYGIFKSGITNHNQKMIKYIGESEQITTNSYHAIYWARLLKKPVTIVGTRPKLHSLPEELNLEECRNICKNKLNLIKI